VVRIVKRIALLLALAVSTPATAQSEWFARAANEAGGEIVLLASRGKCPEMFLRMFSAEPGGKIEWGCYLLSSTHVHAVYDSGPERAYPQSGWTINPVYQTQQRRAPKKPEVEL
jgi:hypothetical protein